MAEIKFDSFLVWLTRHLEEAMKSVRIFLEKNKDFFFDSKRFKFDLHSSNC